MPHHGTNVALGFSYVQNVSRLTLKASWEILPSPDVRERAYSDQKIIAPAGERTGAAVGVAVSVMDHIDSRSKGKQAPVATMENGPGQNQVRTLSLHRENWLSILDDIGLCAVAVEQDGTVSRINESATALVARKSDAVVGRCITELLPELSRSDDIAAHLHQIANSGMPQNLVARHADGQDVPVNVTISYSIHENDDRFLAVIRDLTRQETTLDRLLQSDRLLTDIMGSFQLCAFDWDMRTDEVRFEGSWKNAFGLEAPEGAGDIQWLLDHLHGEDHGLVMLELRDLRKNAVRRIECEARIQPPLGPERWILIRAANRMGDDGSVSHIVGAALDVSSYKSAEEQMAQIVQQDVLTGLPNRQYLLSHIHAHGSEGNFALVVLDIDRFRFVNESLGNRVGDEVLRIIAERMRHRIRKDDVVARLSGDQFAVLIHGASNDKVLQDQIARIRKRISETVNLGTGATVNLDINVGLRRWSPDARISAEELLRDASLALRSAKEMTGSRIVEFYPELQQKMVDAAQFEKDVRTAIRNGGIEAYYQPVIESYSGRPTGFEALARLHHPERGLILPADFIPLAEETGLIKDLAKEIIRQSTRQLAEWRRKHPELPPLTMAVNLSPAQFDDDRIIDDLKTALADAGLQGADLKIEVTESLLMDDPERTVRILDQIRDFGIQVCIDDFGTGYSSLSYLRDYSFDTLKIDRSFISQITQEPRHAELVRTIVQLGQNVGMKIVVEGVENTDQHALLKELGCHFLQGFLVAEPLNAEDATDWLRRWAS